MTTPPDPGRAPDERSDSSIHREASQQFLRYALAIVLAGSAAFLLVIRYATPDQATRAIGPALALLVAVVAWALQARGRVDAAVRTFAIGTWVVATGIVMFNGGVRTPVVIAYPLIVVYTGWRIGLRAALAMAGLTGAVILGLVLAERNGVLPTPPPTPPAMYGVIQIMIVALAATLVIVLVKSYRTRVAELQRTGRELAERTAELQERRAELYRAQAVAKVGSWVYDLAPDAMRLSDETCRIFGVPEGTVGNHDSYLAQTIEQDRNALDAAWHAALASGAFDHEHRIMAGGQVRWVRQRAHIEYDTDGRPLRAVGVSQDITERKLAQDSLRASEERYRVAFRTSPDSININRVADGCYIEVSDGFERITGWRRDEVIGKTSIELGVWADLADRQRMVEILARDGRCENLQFRFCRKDGRQLIGLMSVHPISVDGSDCLLSVTRDVTERIRIEDALRQREKYQRALLDNFPFLVWLKDRESRFLAVNQPFATACQQSSAEQIVGKTDLDVWPLNLAESYRSHDRMVLDSGKPSHLEEVIATSNGHAWFETYKAPVIGDNGEVLGTVGFARDITDRKATEEEIRRLAFYDPLTQLPNRRLLVDRLQQALVSSSRSGKQGALLFIDLDNFKALNDTLGHDVGDQLLQHVAKRLTAAVREGDTVARLGGDEFVVVLEDLSEVLYEAATQAESVGEKILVALNQRYELGGHRCNSSPSIGITLFADYGNSIDELMKRADVAMYQAKDAGRNTLRFFDPEMQEAVTARVALESELREGLALTQLLLHYQPQVDGHGRVTGAEALVRWRHPQRGLVAPGEFIPLAEESGLIVPLGAWVLATACKQLVAWAGEPELAHLTLAVNVSARQFRQNDFVGQILAVLEASGANPRRLKLELTESLLLEDVEDIIAKMHALKAAGVSFALDDFGTGYSSLAYLKRLPLDQLKIDQSFIRDVLADPNDAAIARTIVALAQSMGLAVIAEGVETEAQREFLAGSGCHACQGYLFGRPLPTDEFGALLKRS